MSTSTSSLSRIEEFEKNQKWFWSHFNEILKSHKDSFVAVWHQNIIDKDPDIEHLSKKLHQKRVKDAYVQYVTDQPLEMVL
jgi:hypothetical protein